MNLRFGEDELRTGRQWVAIVKDVRRFGPDASILFQCSFGGLHLPKAGVQK
jgi:hypothetical protein